MRNFGEPLRFTNVEPFAGFSAEAAQGGQQVKIWTRLSLTSDDPLFHRLVENVSNIITHLSHQAGTPVRLDRADIVLMILKADRTAELWVDAAAINIRCIVKRAVTAGTFVFEQDIADITGMSFPLVKFEATDKVLCIFRQDWRFGMAFDFNPDGKLDIEAFNKTLGTLYRELRFAHLYAAIADGSLFEKLVASGWFPFAEIITSEFRNLLDHCESGFDLTEAEDQILGKFDEARTERLCERWCTKPHFAGKKALLSAALNAFNKKEPIAAIKILLTEIEGILNDAYRAAHSGQGANLKNVLSFAIQSAEHKTGRADTLLFPAAFAHYLNKYTFASFNPIAQTGTASSRHAVGHGAAPQESYTMARALQAILTLDQLAFYT